MILLQAATELAQTEPATGLFSMVMKGGWIMIPLFILSALVIYIMGSTGATINTLAKVNQSWLARVIELVKERRIDQAHAVSKESDSALGKMIAAGVERYRMPMKTIEDGMQVAMRQAIARAEAATGYLGMIATIAPMMGFLGTIFGVIKIFFTISLTNDLSIATISDGLYQKMICSAAGLLVGIVSYIGYYIQNRRIDKILLSMEKGGDELLQAIIIAKANNSAV